MSNYTQTTFFAPKDALPPSDPNKTIFGAAYDVEFGNIQTAINSKADTASAASFLSVNVTGNAAPTNGIYLSSANTLAFATNGTLRAVVNSTGNWSFVAPTAGIGLTVNAFAGSAGILQVSANGQYAIRTDQSTSGYVVTQGMDDTGSYVSTNSATRGHRWQINAITQLQLLANGSLNLVSPTAAVTAFTVNGNAAATVLQLKPGGSAAIGLSVLDPGANASEVRLSTTNANVTLATAGTAAIPLRLAIGATVGLTLQTDSGLFTNGATGGSQGSGTINATGLFVNGVSAPVPTWAIKAASETKSSTTLANDNTLTASLVAGTYEIEVFFSVLAATNTNGIALNLNYSGTFTSAASSYMAMNAGNPTVGFAVSSTVTGSGYTQATVTGQNGFLVKGSIVTTGAGTLGLAWGDNTGATNLTISAGAYMRVTKIA